MKIFIIVLALLPFFYIIYKRIKNKMESEENKPLSKKNEIILFLISIILFLIQFGTFNVPSNKVGLVDLKIGKNLNPGQIIAFSGQKGKQAEIIMPGWHYDIFYPWVKSIKMVEDLVVPQGKIAILTAVDGSINNDIVAPKWNKNIDILKMITDYKYFIDNGGKRGIQQLKLTTGTYKINQYQWKVEIIDMIRVNTGEVLVKESIFGEAPKFVETTDDEILAVPLVKSGKYRGIIDKPNPAGLYAIHPYIEKAVTVPVGLQTFIYKGGYTSKIMDIEIDAENDKLTVKKSEIKVPKGGHGAAFSAKTKDNHTVYIGVRVLGQVEPKQAPRFIGTIKRISDLDDKIIEPYTKNILMNIVVKYKALELKNKRQEIGKEISNALRLRTTKTGFRTKTVEITNIDIPPIVLVSGKIASASDALKPALMKKQEAVKEAIKVQNLQEQANQQKTIAEQQVKNKAAESEAKRIIKMADARYYKVKKEADGVNYSIKEKAKAENFSTKQKAEAANFLSKQIGKEAVASLMLQEKINESADKFKVPQTLFISSNGNNATDIVSAHMISKSIKDGLSKSLSNLK